MPTCMRIQHIKRCLRTTEVIACSTMSSLHIRTGFDRVLAVLTCRLEVRGTCALLHGIKAVLVCQWSTWLWVSPHVCFTMCHDGASGRSSAEANCSESQLPRSKHAAVSPHASHSGAMVSLFKVPYRSTQSQLITTPTISLNPEDSCSAHGDVATSEASLQVSFGIDLVIAPETRVFQILCQKDSIILKLSL